MQNNSSFQVISCIVAMTLNGVIGKANDNKLLWHLPNDLKRFKEITIGKPVIMGRKTYESIGKPLPYRQNIVLTREYSNIPGCYIAHSVEKALMLTKDLPEIIVIGGGEIYKLFSNITTKLYITYVDTVDIDGDIFFTFDKSEWKTTFEEKHAKDEKHKYNYAFTNMQKI
jgi:dihydrofolate reductase